LLVYIDVDKSTVRGRICILKHNVVALLPWLSNSKILAIFADFVLRLTEGEISSRTDINHAMGFIIISYRHRLFLNLE
jgi:hypothetical protein